MRSKGVFRTAPRYTGSVKYSDILYQTVRCQPVRRLVISLKCTYSPQLLEFVLCLNNSVSSRCSRATVTCLPVLQVVHKEQVCLDLWISDREHERMSGLISVIRMILQD